MTRGALHLSSRPENMSRDAEDMSMDATDDTRGSVDLKAEARRRFGTDRAAALAPDLDALAADLARVAGASLPPGVEPGFYLLEA